MCGPPCVLRERLDGAVGHHREDAVGHAVVIRHLPHLGELPQLRTDAEPLPQPVQQPRAPDWPADEKVHGLARSVLELGRELVPGSEEVVDAAHHPPRPPWVGPRLVWVFSTHGDRFRHG